MRLAKTNAQLIMKISNDSDQPDRMPKPTIEELEKILASNDKPDIEIQPDGSIRAVPKGTACNADVKPITANYARKEFY